MDENTSDMKHHEFRIMQEGRIVYSGCSITQVLANPETINTRFNVEDPFTIHLSSGMTDRNGTAIFESDRVKVIHLPGSDGEYRASGTIEVINGCFMIRFDDLVYDPNLQQQRQLEYLKVFTSSLLSNEIELIPPSDA
jgi:hypothetical protein